MLPRFLSDCNRHAAFVFAPVCVTGTGSEVHNKIGRCTCCAQSGTGVLSQPTILGEANQFFHKNAGPYAPGQNLLPLGNLRTVDFGGPYNNGVYNLSLLNVQEFELQGVWPCDMLWH